MTISIDAVTAIALNTFRETVRDRVIYAFVLFACVLSLLAILLGSLSVGQDVRILDDLGMAAISLIGGSIAVFAGANLVYKELDRRTVHVIFTKPVTGWQFILGKYLGLSSCLLLIVVAMGLFLALLVCFSSAPPFAFITQDLLLVLKPLSLVYLELLFVIALATFFSTIASPTMSVVFTIGLWLCAHFVDSLKTLGHMSHSAGFARLTDAAYLLLPDLASLTKARAVLVYGQPSQSELLSYITCYVFSYVVLLLLLASVVTERREFR